MTPEEGAKIRFPERDLKDGDQIRVGKTIFRLNVWMPAQCFECSKEIPKDQEENAKRFPGMFQCARVPRDTKARVRRRKKVQRHSFALNAERNVADELGEFRQGTFICAACKIGPSGIGHDMLGKSQFGRPGTLAAIRNFTFERELGRGGKRAVFLVRSMHKNESMALKLMLPHVATNEQAKATRFLREAKNTQALKNRNILAFRELGSDRGMFYFLAEFCENGSVASLMMQTGGRLSLDRVFSHNLRRA